MGYAGAGLKEFMANRKKVLSDHKQVGKKFIPPAAQYGWTELHYVEWILPEIIWIGYFTKLFGAKKGIELVTTFIETCYFLRDWGFLPEFSLLSNYGKLTPEEWLKIRKKLKAKGIFLECLDAFTPFVRCYPTGNPFTNLFDESKTTAPSESDIALTREVVSSVFDRRSKEACIVQSVVFRIDLKVGKHQVPVDYPYSNFDVLIDAFESEYAKDVAAHVRMHINSTYQFYSKQMGDAWARYFWNRGKELVPLKSNNQPPEIPGEEKLHPVVKFGLNYEKYAWGVVDAIWSQLPVDIYESEFAEVIGALLARQCNLAVKIAKIPDLWDFHAGPLFLRPMTDCLITAAWIMKDRTERARNFILYGLGQEKLEIEHLRSVLNEQVGEEKTRLEQRIAVQEMWLNNQHYSFLQYVDIGSWSGISTRKMAEEADLLNLYNFAYTSWSHAAHGTWNHIGKYDALPSSEPLHKYIWQPNNFEHGHQTDVVVQATKYFDEFCILLVEEFKLKMEGPPPNAWVSDRLGQLFSEMDAAEDQSRANDLSNL